MKNIYKAMVLGSVLSTAALAGAQSYAGTSVTAASLLLKAHATAAVAVPEVRTVSRTCDLRTTFVADLIQTRAAREFNRVNLTIQSALRTAVSSFQRTNRQTITAQTVTFGQTVRSSQPNYDTLYADANVWPIAEADRTTRTPYVPAGASTQQTRTVMTPRGPVTQTVTVAGPPAQQARTIVHPVGGLKANTPVTIPGFITYTLTGTDPDLDTLNAIPNNWSSPAIAGVTEGGFSIVNCHPTPAGT